MKNGIKHFLIIALVAIITFAMVGCGGDDKTHTHQWGAYEVTKAATVTADGEETSTCATCGEKQTRPIPQLVSCNCAATYGELTHLEEGETCTCGGVNCTGCLPKVSATLSNGTTKVIKETGVDVSTFNGLVADFNNGLDTFNDIMLTSFGSNIKEIRICPVGTAINHQGTTLSMGADKTYNDVYLYLYNNNIIQFV
jgi:hypothetical protein